MSSRNTWNTRSRKLNLKNQLRTQYENLGRLISSGNTDSLPKDSQTEEILNKIKELEKSLSE